MVTPMLRPDVFGGLATHAGDALFEMCYLPDFRESVRALRDELRRLVRPLLGGLPLAARVREGQSTRAAQRLVHGRVLLGRRRRHRAAALRHRRPGSCGRRCGSAGSPGTRCGWCPSTPTRCARCARSTSTAGKRDEYFLDLGAEAFRRALEAVGVTDVFFELFDATHAAIEYRYPLAVKYLAERLS